MNALRQKIVELLQAVIAKLLIIKKITPIMNTQTENSLKVYAMAKSLLGKPLAKNGELGCMEAVNFVFDNALGFPVTSSASTIDGYKAMQNVTKYIEVDSPLPGDVIIAVTGTGNGTIAHGHIGIVANFGILSNNSDNGLFQEKWDIPSWQDYYGRLGGFKSHFFRVI